MPDFDVQPAKRLHEFQNYLQLVSEGDPIFDLANESKTLKTWCAVTDLESDRR